MSARDGPFHPLRSADVARHTDLNDFIGKPGTASSQRYRAGTAAAIRLELNFAIVTDKSERSGKGGMHSEWGIAFRTANTFHQPTILPIGSGATGGIGTTNAKQHRCITLDRLTTRTIEIADELADH